MAAPPTKGDPLSTLRTFRPHGTAGIYAYYDGRICPFRSSNWYDETLALGVAAYSIVSGDAALLFDAGLTPAHAEHMLSHVRSLGAKDVTTVYSHFHGDHVAGASALRETRIIAHRGTKERLAKDAETSNKLTDEKGVLRFEIVLPTETYEESMVLHIGDRKVELHNFNIHSADSTLLYLPDEGIVFAGDMLEDTVTYISEHENLKIHLRELERMARLPIEKILPAHGSPERIEAGGYDASLIDATIRYLKAVDEPVERPSAWSMRLQEVVKDDIVAGRLSYYEAYEGVHDINVESIREEREEASTTKD